MRLPNPKNADMLIIAMMRANVAIQSKSGKKVEMLYVNYALRLTSVHQLVLRPAVARVCPTRVLVSV
jgi:hypothetical protein